MDGKPLDLSKKTTPSTTKTECLPSEKKRDHSYEGKIQPATQSSSSIREDLLRKRDEAVEQKGTKSHIGSQTSKGSETPECGETVSRNSARKNRITTYNSAIKSERNIKETFYTTSSAPSKTKYKIQSEPGCSNRDSAEFLHSDRIFPRPSTSADTSYSSDSTANQEPTENSYKNTTLVCPVCSKVFLTSYSLQNHITNYHRKESVSSCTSRATTEPLHRKCTSPRPSTSIDSSGSHDLKASQGLAKNLKKPALFVCQYCKRSDFSSSSGLKRHKYHFHRMQSESDNASYSHDSTENQGSVTAKRNFKCDYCGKRFPKSHKLKVHIRSHTGEKPFGCEQCDKTFSTKQNLRVHIRSHTGEKPFTCEYCNQKFKSKSNLNAHTPLHTKKWLFICEDCGQGCPCRSALERHKRIHTEERPYICPKCGRAFNQYQNMKSHEKCHDKKKEE